MLSLRSDACFSPRASMAPTPKILQQYQGLDTPACDQAS